MNGPGRLASWILLMSVLALVPGCAAIGIEVIKPRKTEIYTAHINHLSVRHQVDNNSFYINTETNQLAKLPSPSIDDLARIVGTPAERGDHFIRYGAGKRAWRGIAIDLAIFPVPLTIPLMVPGGKLGSVDFVFGPNETNIVMYSTSSRFYGYEADDKDGGWRWGEPRGFWFGGDQ
jgi:hypothetical protein